MATFFHLLHLLGTCLEKIYVLAFTSGVGSARTSHTHNIEVVAVSQNRTAEMIEQTGNSYTAQKGDIWKLSFTGDFGFSPGACLRYTNNII